MQVIYERDPDVGNGYIAYRGRVQETSDSEVAFIGLHFEAMIRLISKHTLPADNEIIFTRSDRPELTPYPLASELVEAVKTNPQEAIRMMTPPDIRVVIGRRPEPPATLRAGSDTLAAAFGERVLCRARDKELECPGCGKWCSPFMYCTNVFYCRACDEDFATAYCDSNWFFVSVPELLTSKLDRFFLPRKWNGFKPWVDRARLKELYDSFMATKEALHVCI